MEQLSGNLQTDRQELDRLLGVGVNFDVINRDIEIGGRRGRLYVIDGYGDDGVIERIIAFLLGEGAMLAANAFPKVLCGHITSPLDAYLFSQVNDGNCVALPFAQGFGWGGELNLQYTFEKLFCAPGGGGYPKERVIPEQRNKKILDGVKEVTHRDMVTILGKLDRDFVRQALSGEKFSEYFFTNCKCEKLAETVRNILE